MSRYTVYITPDAWADIKRRPGNMRQRVRRDIAALVDNPPSRHAANQRYGVVSRGDTRC